MLKNKLKIGGIFLASLMVLGSAMAPSVSALDATWGPQDREIKKYSDVPFGYPTFNSMTHSPILNAGTQQMENIGDERNFVTVRECESISDTTCITSKTYTQKDVDGNEILTQYTDYAENASAGKYYEVYVFYHNNASSALNASGEGIAEQVKLKMESPNWINAGETAVIKGSISWNNPYNTRTGEQGIWGTNPGEVWDTAFITASERVYLRYVPGSAVIHTNESNIANVPNGVTANGQKLDDAALFTTGSLLAWNAASADTWGLIPGCNEYAGYITFLVKAEQPSFYITKQVAKENSDDWKADIEIAPGETLDFKIHYKNQGTTIQNSVIVYDKLPEGFEYVTGSTKVVSPAAPNGTAVDDKLFSDAGLNIGNFAAGDEAIITYKLRAKDENSFKDCETKVYNEAIVATENGEERDKTAITVKKNCDLKMPSELPQTGMNGTVIGGLILVSSAIVITYKNRTRKARG